MVLSRPLVTGLKTSEDATRDHVGNKEAQLLFVAGKLAVISHVPEEHRGAVLSEWSSHTPGACEEPAVSLMLSSLILDNVDAP
jgi:hypothetical protein